MPSADGPPDPPETAAFERIDWDALDDPTVRPRARTIAFLFLLVALGGVYLYDRYYAHVYLVGQWKVTPIDWLFLLSLAVFVAFVLVPAGRNADRVGTYLRRLRRNRSAFVASGLIGAFVLVALIGPLFVGEPRIRFGHRFHPPAGFTADASIMNDCLGRLSGDRCRWAWAYPLGTDGRGHDMLTLSVYGARVSLYVVLITSMIIVPIAVGTGVVAGYVGGRVDDLAMTYVDVQQFVPAIVLYLLFKVYVGRSLFLLILAFGLLSWGGIARLVRSETLQRREEGYVLAARSAGASRLYVVRKHLLPNVSSTVVPAVAHLIPVLVLTEAGIAFLGFGETGLNSWGMTIAHGLNATSSGRVDPLDQWWVSTIPAILLTVTVAAFKLAGDGLRDTLDPRGER
ncbi:ABC transporter permease [Halosolutus halophilus]|uniref:ABC transporter permease n=1 Tax=Halosolutus halophilus TaxID=1552990 RepID=UPI0022351671|nr:ABC transporter permease [Halosolutus halophilus]